MSYASYPIVGGIKRMKMDWIREENGLDKRKKRDWISERKGTGQEKEKGQNKREKKGLDMRKI